MKTIVRYDKDMKSTELIVGQGRTREQAADDYYTRMEAAGVTIWAAPEPTIEGPWQGWLFATGAKP